MLTRAQERVFEEGGGGGGRYRVDTATIDGQLAGVASTANSALRGLTWLLLTILIFSLRSGAALAVLPPELSCAVLYYASKLSGCWEEMLQ